MRSHIIFDLDGTLADTAPDLIATLNRVIEPHQAAPVAMSQVGQVVGHGARAMIARAFELSGIHLPEQLHDELFRDFLADYSENLANHTKLFDGAERALETLREMDCTFSVCTNKQHAMAVRLLEALEVSHWFAAVTGGDSFPYRKPDARHLSETVRLAGQSLSSAIMVGDSQTDINAARNAGVPSIVVTFGYSDHPVDTLGADRIISSYSQLPDAVGGLRLTA